MLSLSRGLFSLCTLKGKFRQLCGIGYTHFFKVAVWGGWLPSPSPSNPIRTLSNIYLRSDPSDPVNYPPNHFLINQHNRAHLSLQLFVYYYG